VFAEVVAECLSSVKSIDSVFKLLTSITESGKGKIDQYFSRRQKLQGENIRYKPRFGMHQLSIACTLGLLLRYQKNIAAYIAANERFLLRATGESDSITWRMAFLLYLISYSQIHRGMLSFRFQEQKFLQNLRRKDNELQLENRYRNWLSQERFHKRLWAALRDYLKPGSHFEVMFVKSLEGTLSAEFIHLLGDRDEILSWLELPGDT